ncbi:MAG: hypothetical protein KGI75_28250, partial [Rhizobiaceae bacterium]|nr:hypothetical protein [Rhizobiaceae bacterium]
MSIETTPPIDKIRQGAIHRPARPWQRLARRYAVRRSRQLRLPWLGYALTAINIVLIAFLVFDAPLGQAAKNLSPQLIEIAGTITDVGRLISILT